MVDLVVTAANVIEGSGPRTASGVAGAAITAGQLVYLDTAVTGKWLLSSASAATAIARGQSGLGIALNNAASGQPIDVHLEGDITIGATLTAGTSYYLSGTNGGIAPVADITVGKYFVFLGMARSTTVLAFRPMYSGVSA